MHAAHDILDHLYQRPSPAQILLLCRSDSENLLSVLVAFGTSLHTRSVILIYGNDRRKLYINAWTDTPDQEIMRRSRALHDSAYCKPERVCGEPSKLRFADVPFPGSSGAHQLESHYPDKPGVAVSPPRLWDCMHAFNHYTGRSFLGDHGVKTFGSLNQTGFRVIWL